jgi:hypothetical protein
METHTNLTSTSMGYEPKMPDLGDKRGHKLTQRLPKNGSKM